MSEPVFLRSTPGLSLDEIAALTGAEAPVNASKSTISNIAPLDRAGPDDLSFLDNNRFTAAAANTHAGACLTTAALAASLPDRVIVLTVRQPYRAFVAAARALFPHALRPSSLYPVDDVTGARVHPTARLENGVTLEPGVVVGAAAEIGAGSVVGANAVIGADVRIGRDTSIGAGATISHALIGDRVIIHAGCRIGQDGFGFLMDGTRHLKIPQVGRVIIQDDVEIGAGTAVDRGFIRDTVIGEGTKIDNLVQVGHNVSIGRHCILVAQTGVSGSCTLEDYVVLGARVGLSNNVTVGEGAQLAASSNSHASVPAGARWGGTPAKPMTLWFREVKALARLARQGGGANVTAED
jgi:UDP-3-O-[3-hydroxymyristoyl] glucosamine N-acyltransferase